MEDYRWKIFFRSNKKKKDLRTYDNIWKIPTGPGDDYTIVCILDSISQRIL